MYYAVYRTQAQSPNYGVLLVRITSDNVRIIEHVYCDTWFDVEVYAMEHNAMLVCDSMTVERGV